ncbi:RNA polymerase II C-terminal domain phosphatase-like [Musa troglodytarum]|uniref:protein-serine/threonine phosphatase n=1 Tax=Musa troglodytarum TaxID=320322 RepID=A0A9E7EXF6_9LILI|nr:RNA polymerase II C-terminal domain phosphatase-like [Musa troglodytarum]
MELYSRSSNTGSWIREIRISRLSPTSERCPPLAVPYTVAPGGFCFKMESKSPPSLDSPLFSLHATCFNKNKLYLHVHSTHLSLGLLLFHFVKKELHLVAMASRKNPMSYAFFWGFIVRSRLYESSVMMPNLRCLGIVFDLDETLIVANTIWSFKDQDQCSSMKNNDEVVDNGKVFKVHPEAVPPLSDSHQSITPPVIRFAWEDPRSYLTARGCKCFEVYVRTTSERDYALEMWRLLDPDSSLINSSKLLDHIVRVKSAFTFSFFYTE